MPKVAVSVPDRGLVERQRQQEYLQKVFPLIIEQYEGKKTAADITKEIEKVKQENPHPEEKERGK